MRPISQPPSHITRGRRYMTYSAYKPPLTADQFRDLLRYEPDTGNLIWKRRPNGPAAWNTQFSGRVVGSKNEDGYLKMLTYGRTYLCHRVIWYMMTGEWPATTIDHRNCVRDDNRWDNLRLATCAQNSQNSQTMRAFTAPRAPGLKGVNYHQQTGRWIGRIKAAGKFYYLGIFGTAEDAHAAYVDACHRLHGEFARPE
jgi:hypothetical protein